MREQGRWEEERSKEMKVHRSLHQNLVIKRF